MDFETPKSKAQSAIQFAHQAERLSLLPHDQQSEHSEETTAVEAKFITPSDPVVETANGGRLPAVPLSEALKLNQLKDQVEGSEATPKVTHLPGSHMGRQQTIADVAKQAAAKEEELEDAHSGSTQKNSSSQSSSHEAPLGSAIPPSRTNPLFPPLPLYGPPSLLRNLQCTSLRVSSFFLSLAFLGVIVLGSAFTSIPLMFRHIGLRLTFRNPDARRPFHQEEVRRRNIRKEAENVWKRQKRRNSRTAGQSSDEEAGQNEEYEPKEGGKDPLVCDVGYYARRVGLDIETFKVQTEDGFIITLWHVYNPKEYTSVSQAHRDYGEAEVFPPGHVANGQKNGASATQFQEGKRRYPVLLVHGLLQSAGAYCTNDDDSLAFFLCKRSTSSLRSFWRYC